MVLLLLFRSPLFLSYFGFGSLFISASSTSQSVYSSRHRVERMWCERSAVNGGAECPSMKKGFSRSHWAVRVHWYIVTVTVTSTWGISAVLWPRQPFTYIFAIICIMAWRQAFRSFVRSLLLIISDRKNEIRHGGESSRPSIAFIFIIFANRGPCVCVCVVCALCRELWLRIILKKKSENAPKTQQNVRTRPRERRGVGQRERERKREV